MDTKLLSGLLDLLILETLFRGPSYGYAISQEVLQRSGQRFELKEGSLYPALHRLEQQKFLDAFWGEYEGRRRKYYRLSTLGAQALQQKRHDWRELATGINGVLGLKLGPA